jgi:pectinesterase
LRLANGDTINTWTSASFFIYANDFTARKICFQNNSGFTAGQSVALFVYGSRAFFQDCKMLGFQDVLFCSGPGSKQLYSRCYIEGTTDFIFGPATAYFDHCEMHSKKNSHVTAASTPREAPFGFVFRNCRLTADSGINKVSLGRPWQPWANVAYLNCQLGEHIIPEGWSNWKNPDNEKTARYAEFDNTGPGSSVKNRVNWSKQLTIEESKKYELINVLGEWGERKLTSSSN